MRIAILDDYLDIAKTSANWSALEQRAEVTVFYEPFDGEDSVVDALDGFEILVAMRERTRFPKSTLERLPELKLLVTTGMRNASIDVAAARANGVTVCGTRSSKQSTAEHALALLLGLARNIAADHAAMRTGGWQSRLGMEMHGRTLGLLGLGSIGSLVAQFGLAMGMQVIAWSSNLTDDRAAELGVTRVDKETLFAESDFLSVHLVLGERSRGLVGADELALMKPSAFLVNTSRAPIVDTDALMAALNDGRLGGAALDVYESEPLPAEHPLRTTERVLLSPHMGYVSDRNMALMYADAVEDIVAFMDGAPIRTLE